MGKILLINGSPKKQRNTYSALSILEQFLNAAKIETELIHLGEAPVAGCIDCKNCIRDKKCSFDDFVNQILSKVDDYSGMVVGTPVYFGGPTGQTYAFLERLFIASQGRLQGKLGTSVVCCTGGGASSTIDYIAEYFIKSGLKQVGSYYKNQVYDPQQPDISRKAMISLAQQIVDCLKVKP